jgi:hypothetical protein
MKYVVSGGTLPHRNENQPISASTHEQALAIARQQSSAKNKRFTQIPRESLGLWPRYVLVCELCENGQMVECRHYRELRQWEFI